MKEFFFGAAVGVALVVMGLVIVAAVLGLVVSLTFWPFQTLLGVALAIVIGCGIAGARGAFDE